MSNIIKVNGAAPVENIADTYTTTADFNAKVLSYLQQQQPQDSLNVLLKQIRGLSSDKAPSMHELNTALLTANVYMRNDDKYGEYATNTLDRVTMQMLGMNMLYNKMIYKIDSLEEDLEMF